MSKTKQIFSVLLAVCMLVSMFTFTASAAGTNVGFSVDKKSVNIGDEVTVTISNSEASLFGFGVIFEFNSDVLECTEITGVAGDEAMGLWALGAGPGGSDAFTGANVSDSVEDTNADGIFSFGVFGDAKKGTTFKAGTVATLTFKATAVGEAEFSLTEDSTGADGNRQQLAQSGSVEVIDPNAPVAVNGVEFNKAAMTLTVGKSSTLTATVTPANATNKSVTWTSSDESVATVNNGKVTAIAEGTATITVTTVDGGYTASCVVTVKAKAVEPDEPSAPVVPVIPTYTVNVPADIAGGTVTVSNTNPEQGEIVTITATPDRNYKLVDVIINGVSYGPISPINYVVYGDLNITATFAYEPSFIEGAGSTTSKPSMYDKVLGMAGMFPNYTDVLPTDWFYSNVMWAWNRNILDYGVTFAPNTNATRATIVEWIWRMEGRPVVSGVAFDDTSATSAAWAASVGIVNGYGNGKFGPDDLVTREQLAAILYRYANYKGINTNARGDLSKFSDAAQISDYAVEPMQWAVGVGMINGYPNGTVQPQGNATRAELTALLNRMSVWYGI